MTYLKILLPISSNSTGNGQFDSQSNRKDHVEYINSAPDAYDWHKTDITTLSEFANIFSEDGHIHRLLPASSNHRTQIARIALG